MVTGVIDTVRALAPLVRQAGREVAAVRHLAHFVRYTWPIIEPGTPLLWNWHIDAVSRTGTSPAPRPHQRASDKHPPRTHEEPLGVGVLANVVVAV